MKRFIIPFFVGIVFVPVMYLLLSLILGGEMLDFSSQKLWNMMIPQMLICGILWGIIFTIIGILSKRNKSKQENERVMREYFEYQMKKDMMKEIDERK